MKNTSGIQVYFGLFKDLEDMCREFELNKQDLDGVDIIYAHYDYESYEGSAEVLFVKNNTLYEVVHGHCSCSGLEGGWEPEETSVVAILARPNITTQAKDNIRAYYKNILCFL